MSFTRVFDILPYQLENFPKEDALGYKKNGTWLKYSTQEYINISNQLSYGLLKYGIKRDDKVAIISMNRPEWNFVDIALQQIGAVSVPMYPTMTVDDFRFIFNDSELNMIFVSTQELYQKAKAAAQGNENIKGIFTFDNLADIKHWCQLLIENPSEEIKTQFENAKNSVQPEDLLTLIYTSGTTGTPKGVMLTHNNLVSNVTTCQPLVPVDSSSRALSFLPLCHVYERMLSYVYQYCGLSIYYAESIETISDNLKEVNPHIFVTVPRLLEKVFDKIVAKGSELSGIKKMLFFWALDLGLKYELGGKNGVWYDIQLKIANKLIFNKWREALGGNIKCIVSGGAALQPRLARVFSAGQIVVLEGYGLTETSPVIAVNRMEEENRQISTVGPVIDGAEVKIAVDGEILVKGPMVMKGYYKRPDLTAECIDTDGWFHTGDIGTFVDNKFLKITDRKKEIFKTSGGKYISPQLMENKFKESKFIEQIMVVGDGQKFPAALIVPSFTYLKDWCEIKGITYTNNEEMVKRKEIKERFGSEINDINESFAQYEKIKKFHIMAREWTVVDGELAPKLSLKRKVIFTKNQTIIETMYAETRAD